MNELTPLIHERRFTISSHSWPVPHIDFFLESPACLDSVDNRKPESRSLWTWRLIDFPINTQLLNQPLQGLAERLPEHRYLYLSYAGAVSGDRGEVIILHQGTAQLTQNVANIIDIRLCGNLIRGLLTLNSTHNNNITWFYKPE
jgi:hypothetical protein